LWIGGKLPGELSDIVITFEFALRRLYESHCEADDDSKVGVEPLRSLVLLLRPRHYYKDINRPQLIIWLTALLELENSKSQNDRLPLHCEVGVYWALRLWNKVIHCCADCTEQQNVQVASRFLASAYEQKGQYDKAYAVYRKATESSDDLALLGSWAKGYTDNKEHEKAVILYETILKRDSKDVHTQRKLGRLYTLIGDYRKAAAICQQVSGPRSYRSYIVAASWGRLSNEQLPRRSNRHVYKSVRIVPGLAYYLGSAYNAKDIEHYLAGCDGCRVSPIRGYRYKCMICEDYDLCPEYQTSMLHQYPQHWFLEIPSVGWLAENLPKENVNTR